MTCRPLIYCRLCSEVAGDSTKSLAKAYSSYQLGCPQAHEVSSKFTRNRITCFPYVVARGGVKGPVLNRDMSVGRKSIKHMYAIGRN